MKTIINGMKPGTTEPAELTIEPVFPMTGEAMVDVCVGDAVVRVSLREISGAMAGAEKAVPPPGWSLYGPHGTWIQGQDWLRQG